MRSSCLRTATAVLFLVLSRAAFSQATASLKEVTNHTTYGFANNLHFSQNGNMLVLAVASNAHVYEKKDNGFQQLQILYGQGGPSVYPGISDDGTYVAFSSAEYTEIYKSAAGKYNLFQTITHKGSSDNKEIAIRFTDNGHFYAVNGDGHIRFYQLQNDQFVEAARSKNPAGNLFRRASVSPDGKLAVTVDENGDVRCWKLGKNVAQAGNVLTNVASFTGKVTVSNDGLLATGSKKTLTVFTLSADLNTATAVQTMTGEDLSYLAFSTDGQRLLAATEDKLLTVYKKSPGGFIPEYQNEAGVDYINALDMSPDGQWLAASSQSGKFLKIYEAPAPVKTPVKGFDPKALAAAKKSVAQPPAKPAVTRTAPASAPARDNKADQTSVKQVSADKPQEEITATSIQRSLDFITATANFGTFSKRSNEGETKKLFKIDNPKLSYTIKDKDIAFSYSYDAIIENTIEEGPNASISVGFVQSAQMTFNFSTVLSAEEVILPTGPEGVKLTLLFPEKVKLHTQNYEIENKGAKKITGKKDETRDADMVFIHCYDPQKRKELLTAFNLKK